MPSFGWQDRTNLAGNFGLVPIYWFRMGKPFNKVGVNAMPKKSVWRNYSGKWKRVGRYSIQKVWKEG